MTAVPTRARCRRGHSAPRSLRCAGKRPPRPSPETVSAAGRVSPGGRGRVLSLLRADRPPASPQILVHIGFLTEESGDVFSPRVLKGGPLGEMVQWADILAALYVLGHGLRVTVSLKELQR